MQAKPPGARFHKVLKRWDVLALSFGAMIGWSWVLMTGYWLEHAGSLGVFVAFAAAGLAITLIGLTYGELASAMPQAGGEHIYTKRALGPVWSFVCTWALLFAYLSVCLFEAVALPTAIEYLTPSIRLGALWRVLGADVDLGFVLIGAGASILFTLVNVLGIKFAARVQNLVTLMIFLAGLLLFSGALGYGQLETAKPFIATPASGILVVMIMVPALLVGFDVIPQSAEEINLPQSRIGRLLVISVVLAVLWYVLIGLAVAVALPVEALGGGGLSLATGDAAAALWGGRWAGVVLVLGGVGGILTSWNAFIIGGSRVMFALAESGQIPRIFARLHPKYRTPYVSVITIGILCCAAPLFGRTILVWLVNVSSFAVTLAFLFVAIAFIRLRQTAPDMARPFKVRHGQAVGWGAIALSAALLSIYLPWSPSALLWPYEWSMILSWALLGALLLAISRLGGFAKGGR